MYYGYGVYGTCYVEIPGKAGNYKCLKMCLICPDPLTSQMSNIDTIIILCFKMSILFGYS